MVPQNPAGEARPRPPAARLVLVALVVLVAVAVLAAVLVLRPNVGPRGVGIGRPTAIPTRPTGSGPSGFDPARVAVTLESVADGLTAPVAIVNAGDGSSRLFVAEQGGRIRIVRDGRVGARPFLDISGRITSGGERGLLGLAFAPDYPTDPRVFVDYSDRAGDTQVSSFLISAASPDQADPETETPILHVKQPFANHNGGALLFDPSGMLLVSLGDGGSGGDQQRNGQSLATLLGKILRIDVAHPDAGHPYAIPADNPYAAGAAGHLPEIWLTGLRNPWRMSFDRTTHDLWIGDVGQNAWEEVDVHRAGAPAGTNYGWNRMEGTHCFEPPTNCENSALTPPLSDYGHDLGCTVIGGAVYRGSAQAALVGGYVFADYCSGRFWTIDPAVDGYRSPVLVDDSGISPSAFGEDEAGELFVADISGGRILRVMATAR